MRAMSCTSTTCSASSTRQRFRLRWARHNLQLLRPRLPRQLQRLLRLRLRAVHRLLPLLSLERPSHRRQHVALLTSAVSISRRSPEPGGAVSCRNPMCWSHQLAPLRRVHRPRRRAHHRVAEMASRRASGRRVRRCRRVGSASPRISFSRSTQPRISRHSMKSTCRRSTRCARSTRRRSRRSTVSSLSLIHISEPTRLGMISYAVFCLKKKKKKKKQKKRNKEKKRKKKKRKKKEKKK